MEPYPPLPGSGYVRVEVDGETQIGRYYDHNGSIVEMPGHGTTSGTNPPTGTGGRDDGNILPPDRDTGNDTDQ